MAWSRAKILEWKNWKARLTSVFWGHLTYLWFFLVDNQNFINRLSGISTNILCIYVWVICVEWDTCILMANMCRWLFISLQSHLPSIRKSLSFAYYPPDTYIHIHPSHMYTHFPVTRQACTFYRSAGNPTWSTSLKPLTSETESIVLWVGTLGKSRGLYKTLEMEIK